MVIPHECNHIDTCLSGRHQFNQFCCYGSGQSKIPEALMAHSGVHSFCACPDRGQHRLDCGHAYISSQNVALVFSVRNARHSFYSDTDRNYSGNVSDRISYNVTIIPPSLAYILLTPAISMITTSLKDALFSISERIYSARSGQLQCVIISVLSFVSGTSEIR